MPLKGQRDKTQRKRNMPLVLLVVIPLLPLILVVAVVLVIGWLIRGVWLKLLVRLRWYPQGKYLLFVYSDSPNWKDYIEANILPRIRPYALVLNWSQRSRWNWRRKPLEVKVFEHWCLGTRYFGHGSSSGKGWEYNPVAITFLPWWQCRVFRFWQPFKDFKHREEKPLKELEAKLFGLLEVIQGG